MSERYRATLVESTAEVEQRNLHRFTQALAKVIDWDCPDWSAKSMMSWLGFATRITQDGSLVVVDYHHARLGEDEEHIVHRVAKHFKAGTYMRWQVPRSFEIWEWVFTGTTMVENYGKVIWFPTYDEGDR